MYPLFASTGFISSGQHSLSVADSSGSLCRLIVKDSSEYIYEYHYTIETVGWLIKRIEKYDNFNSSLSKWFMVDIFYVENKHGIMIPEKITFSGDTTLDQGGYRFFDSEVNNELEDSLFSTPIVWKQVPKQPVSVRKQKIGIYNLLGRSLPAGRINSLQYIITYDSFQKTKGVGKINLHK